MSHRSAKYSPSGTRVDVKVYPKGDEVCCSVADQGIGIPEEDIPSLFREFFRASNARSSEVEGTGLGLAAVMRIVKRFSGNIWVDSKEDQGSTFYVSFPAYNPKQSTIIVNPDQ